MLLKVKYVVVRKYINAIDLNEHNSQMLPLNMGLSLHIYKKNSYILKKEGFPPSWLSTIYFSFLSFYLSLSYLLLKSKAKRLYGGRNFFLRRVYMKEYLYTSIYSSPISEVMQRLDDYL